MSELWIDVKTLASLKGVTDRAVRICLNSGRYTCRKSRRGYEVLLSSLELELQEKYSNEKVKEVVLGSVTDLTGIQEPVKSERIIPEEAKRVALARLDLLKLWDKFRLGRDNKSQANRDFIELYNTGEVYKNIYEIIGKVSIGTVYRWKLDLGSLDSDDWTKLLPAYAYTGSSEYRTILTDEEIGIFLRILLHPNRFNIGKAIGLTKYILSKRGVEMVPRDITFRRYAQWFKKHNYDTWILAREGQKALKDKVEPYIVRDPSVLDVGDVLVADGHRLNFQVINPFTGKPVRATLVGFLDWKSSALIGYEIMLEENTQCIASALRNSIINLGRFPKICYQDNGKAFKSRFFTGDKEFDELGFNGIYGKLGIKPVFAAPYNARAKVIERFFLEFQESFEKLVPSYIGTSIENKPAYMKRNEKLHKEIHSGYVPTIEEAIRLIDSWLEYKHSQACPHVEGKSILEVLGEVKKEEIDIDKLDDLMMAEEVKTIGRNGIRFLKSDYYDDSLYGFKGQVIIKYSLFNLSFIKVYSKKGEFMCSANRVMPTHPMAQHLGDVKDMEDYKQKIVKQQKLRKKTIQEVTKLFTPEEIAEFSVKQLEDKEKPKKLLTVDKSSEISSRRIFKTKYERYEWILKNGSNDEKEVKWMEEYRATPEYKMIYGEVM